MKLEEGRGLNYRAGVDPGDEVDLGIRLHLSVRLCLRLSENVNRTPATEGRQWQSWRTRTRVWFKERERETLCWDGRHSSCQ